MTVRFIALTGRTHLKRCLDKETAWEIGLTPALAAWLIHTIPANQETFSPKLSVSSLSLGLDIVPLDQRLMSVDSNLDCHTGQKK